MRARIEQELAVVRERYPDIEHIEHVGEDWFRLPGYSFPSGWRINGDPVSEAPIIFKIVASYPSGEPYGFAAPAGINFNGAPPENTGSLVNSPFSGTWQQFSWAPDGWEPTAEARKGSNLLAWIRSFGRRLEEGA